MLMWIYNAVPHTVQQPAHIAPKVAVTKLARQQSKILVTSHSGSHVVSLPKSKARTSTITSKPIISSAFLSANEPKIPVLRRSTMATFADEHIQPAIAAPKLVTLNLSETAIATVVSIISKQTGVNVILMAKSDQKVTINVAQMPLTDAMKHLAMLAGLRSIRVNNAFIIADETALKSVYPKEFENEYGLAVKTEVPSPSPTGNEGKTTPSVTAEVQDVIQRIYNLKYQDAALVSTALKEYFGTLRVTITALPNTMLPNLGNSGGGISSGGSASSGGSTASTVPVETRGKRVLLSGPSAGVQETMTILQQMDIPRKQVEITVTIHDVSNDALRDAGVTWDFGRTTISEAVNGNINVGTFSRTGLSFVGTIHALETSGKAKLLASPNISMMDGVQSSILIGEKRRFPVVNGTTSNGQFIYSTEEQNVGIYLMVAADITDDGTVTMAVNAQVSSILGFLQLNGGSYPQISTRESKSTLLLKDGQTMLMGGLLRDQEVVNFQKVPFLSQIPFFGELFKSRNTQKNSSQLLISITPHIIK
jgi:type II secretory pathway component GspD/PulD (secretin)